MRLILCDDHRLLVTGLALALADLGHTIEAAATTPSEAMEAIDRREPDALLVDLHFPDGSGLDVARWVSARHPRVTVVAMTGSDDPTLLTAALESGVRGYVRKAQRIERIAEALERAASGELAVDQELLTMVRSRRTAGERSSTAASPLGTLTARERRVLRLLAEGRSTAEMGAALGISLSTVKTHVQSVFVKLQVHSRLQAVALVDRLNHGQEWDDARAVGE